MGSEMCIRDRYNVLQCPVVGFARAFQVSAREGGASFGSPCIGIVAIKLNLPDVLCLCEVTKNDGKANEAILERYMIVLND